MHQNITTHLHDDDAHRMGLHDASKALAAELENPTAKNSLRFSAALANAPVEQHHSVHNA